MASLVLGAVGGYFFGPIGFLIGSAVGNLLTPGAKQEGPRVNDKKLQTSSYGEMIPICYGVCRLSGQVIWQTDLVEHKHVTGGKGAGPEVTTFTYTVSFAVEICEGPADLLKVWADGTLDYDVTSTSTLSSTIPITIYHGDETQLPDPTMEADLGVGNVPAYRGLMYVVFTDWDVGAYGNRIPSLSFLIATHAQHIPLRIISQVTQANTFAASYGPDRLTISGDLLTAHYPTLYAGTRFNGPAPIGAMSGTEYQYDALGVPLVPASIPYAYPGGFEAEDNWANWFIGMLGEYPVWFQNDGHGGSDPRGFLVVGGRTLGQEFVSLPGTGEQLQSFALTQDGKHLHVFARLRPSDDLSYRVYDDTITLIHSYTPTGTNPFGSISVVALPGNDICMSVENGGDILWVFDPAGGGIACRYYTINKVTGEFTLVDSCPYVQTGNNYSEAITLNGRAWLVGGDQVIVFDRGAPYGPIPLSEIVSDVSVRSGLSTSNIDVSRIPFPVDGFIISRQADAKTSLTQLLSAYYVDAVESSGVVKYVPRGDLPTLTIPDDELAAHEYGAAPPSLASIKRTQEVDIPATVNVTYINTGASYQNGTQQSRREVTRSQSVASVQFAIAMSDDKARQIAQVLNFGSWIERDTVTVRTSRKYMPLEPADVFIARGYALRIVSKTDAANGVIQFDCVVSLASLYTQSVTSNATRGGTQTSPVIAQPTNVLLLDIPLVNDADDPNGFYAAAAGATDATWKGYALQRSVDGGTTYATALSATTPSVIGITVGVLPSFAGNVFDEGSSVDVIIGNGGGTLASATELAVLNGANMWLIGNEIVQSKNAVLIAANTYRLTGHLRGRRGTEWATTTHVTGERFVVLPVPRVSAPATDLYHTDLYKAVSKGKTLAGTTSFQFANTGNSLKPYSPTDVGGGCDASGNVTMNWKRRTRIGGAWMDYADVPLSEATEGYIVQIWDASYTICARIISGLTTPTCTYTAAQQTTDFGAVQKNVFFTVGQVGAFTLGSQARGVAPSTGGSNNAPTTPIQPYVAPPLIPPPAPGPSRPVNAAIAWPSDSKIIPINIGSTWVGSFTVGASPPLSGNFSVSEFGSTRTDRRIWLATDSGGSQIVANSMQIGTTATVQLSPPGTPHFPTLLASTTYYLLFDFTEADGSLSGPPGTPAQTILNLGNVTF